MFLNKMAIAIQTLVLVIPMVFASGVWVTFPLSGLLSSWYNPLVGFLVVVQVLTAVIAFFASISLLYLSLCWFVENLVSKKLISLATLMVKFGVAITLLGFLAHLYNAVWELRIDAAQMFMAYVIGVVMLPPAFHQLYLYSVNKSFNTDASDAGAG